MCVNIVLGARSLRTRPITYAIGRTATVKAGPNDGLVCAWNEPLKILGL
jgi:hypothetical protein